MIHSFMIHGLMICVVNLLFREEDIGDSQKHASGYLAFDLYSRDSKII